MVSSSRDTERSQASDARVNVGACCRAFFALVSSTVCTVPKGDDALTNDHLPAFVILEKGLSAVIFLSWDPPDVTGECSRLSLLHEDRITLLLVGTLGKTKSHHRKNMVEELTRKGKVFDMLNPDVWVCFLNLPIPSSLRMQQLR